MKVVLTTPVRKLGYPGDVVVVKKGYAKNYLLPQNLAKRATQQQMSLLEEQKEEFVAKNAEIKSKAIAAKAKINDKHLNFIVQTAVDGRLFGSVALRDIAMEVSNKIDYKLTNSQVLLDTPIKATGVYKVVIALHPEIEASILAVVAKTEAEAAELLAEYRNPPKEEKPAEEQFAELQAASNSDFADSKEDTTKSDNDLK